MGADNSIEIKEDEFDALLDEIHQKEKGNDLFSDLNELDVKDSFKEAFRQRRSSRGENNQNIHNFEVEKERFVEKTIQILDAIPSTNCSKSQFEEISKKMPLKITWHWMIEHKNTFYRVFKEIIRYGLFVKVYWSMYGDDAAIAQFDTYKQFVDINTRNVDANGRTLLHRATMCRGLTVIKRLLTENEINLSIKDAEGKTALDIAKMQGKWDIAQELVQHSMGVELKERAKAKIKELERTKGIGEHWFAVCNDENIMNGICDNIKTLIRNKQPFSGEMLMIAVEWELKQQMEDKRNILETNIYQVIMETLNICLVIPPNKRDFNWFKLYLMDSLIWFQKVNAEGKLLFDELNELSTNKLSVQREFLKETIDALEEEKESHWEALKNYPQFIINMDGKIQKEGLRQDSYELMSNPTRCIFNKKQLHTMNTKISNFDVVHHNDVHSYLSQLLTTAHALNDIFHETLSKRIYATDIETGTLRYQPGNVKRLERCQAKAETDYAMCSFPSTAKILDFIRCSLTYSSPKHLVEGIDKLKEAAQSGKYAIKRILRIKNMFLEHKRNNRNVWDLYKYTDIKLNVLLEHNDVSMVVEVQYLLDFMLKAKKLGHGLYEIERNKEFVHNVDKMRDIQFCDLDQSLRSAVTTNDDKTLAQLMFNKSLNIDMENVGHLVVAAVDQRSKKAGKFLVHYALNAMKRDESSCLEHQFCDILSKNVERYQDIDLLNEILKLKSMKMDEAVDQHRGLTVWLNAIYDGNIEIAKALYKRNDIDFKRKSKYYGNAMSIAIRGGNTEMINWLSSIGFSA